MEEKNFADFLKKGPTKNFHFTFSSIPRQVTLWLCKPFSCIVSKTWNFFSLPVCENTKKPGPCDVFKQQSLMKSKSAFIQTSIKKIYWNKFGKTKAFATKELKS